jgi:hypothetical protein
MRSALKLSAAALMAVCIVRSVAAARRQSAAVSVGSPDEFFVSSSSDDADIPTEVESSRQHGHAILGHLSRPLRQSPNSAAVPAGSFAYSFHTAAGSQPQNTIYPLRGDSHLGVGGVRHSGALRWSTTART